jgi:secreted Zn-dependent insulinase-like peptidase
MIENMINNEAFNFLRTEKNLGYIALASLLETETINGLIIGV